ncbi:site-specific DNA-methyltransferase [Limosilactobacillus reuteri]|uniref:Site-specific DNA-methyltransferase n=1 Tax=Limosilactobacillus reuteri TaxID=1598 RepID=A0A6L5P4Y8_LIMRT|nr:site-specific DNA-methyltransferase [Limosilactobacillus reuteri]MRH09474.1 site-specific DNA-methyltransferase [Limosilactobacillus reuteri]OYS62510.1 DNA methyltransferase [Limosilactobacillus reuteri]OYS78081.1 DNA methyltransferase [Limosilactobacillus reuteri]OYS87104.1 DNA methyltransferase [Limosilactobacillus reuteri]OYT10113.1 DNA methyltransferase [Limosilactobacillus reuteri]
MQIETKMMEQVKTVLQKFGMKYITENGALKRSAVINDLDKYDYDLMTALLSNKLIHDEYTELITNTEVFKLNQFINMFEYKEFWEDSFTKYANRIGLTSDGKFISDSSDVVLDFPYKDTVLKAGMSKEDADSKLGGVDEPFLNEILAHSEISELLEPKILINAKRYDVHGECDVTQFNEQDNLIIKGNNLIALHSLKRKYSGKVNLIYFDVPFNTSNDFPYNDKYTRSTWLTFLQNRLTIAKKLLADNGSIFVHIDWHEDAYLKVLLDEVFGEDNLVNEIVWHYGSGGSYKNSFAKKHDTIFWYSKTPNYKYFPDNKMVGEKRGPQKRNNMKKNIDDDGRVYYSIKSAGKIYKYYEDDLVTPDDVWDVSILQQKDPERMGFNSQKPERLLARIIGATTKENDLVLDSFMGSATTQAVAMKMKRHFIGIEQMDYINTLSVPRLQKVINGGQEGISKKVNWQGGGSFVYAELMEKNQEFLHDLQKATDVDELNEVYQRMKLGADFDFRVDLATYENNSKRQELSFNEQKKILIRILDKNQLYYNEANIDDADVRYLISDSDYKFNKSFYEKELK